MKKEHSNIFLVDDNTFFAKTSALALKNRLGCPIKVFTRGIEMLQYLSENPKVIILDYQLDKSDLNCTDILQEITKRNLDVAVIILSEQQDQKIAISLLKLGAIDYIVKNDSYIEILTNSIKNILKVSALAKDIELLKIDQKKLKNRLLFAGITF